jgi:hypothetical protein
MNRLPRAALLALSALALAARASHAQEIRSPLRHIEQTQAFSVFAGYLVTDPALQLNDSTSVELGPRSAPIVGARYQLRVSGPLSISLTGAFVPSERRVFLAEASADSSAINPIDTGETVSSSIVLGEAGLNFGLTGPRAWNGLAPYIGVSAGLAAEVGGGGGVEDEVPEPERFDFGPAFAVGLRLGTDVFVARRASLRLELNGRLWRVSAPGGFLSASQSGITEWKNASSAQVGATFHF